MAKPKILLWDLETLPNICYAFDLYSYKKPDMIIKEKSILTFSYKWLGGKTTNSLSILDFQDEKHLDPYDDRDLVEAISKVIEEADYTVAHFGDKFDNRFLRARAVINNLPAPAIVPTIDTYKLIKKHFYFNANKLDYIGKVLGLGGKMPMGWKFWELCAQGDVDAIRTMEKYNRRDVELLEKVFLKILPHCDTKLNYNLFNDKDETVCVHCGSNHIQKRGTIVTRILKRQRYACQDCGTWFSTKMDK